MTADPVTLIPIEADIAREMAQQAIFDIALRRIGCLHWQFGSIPACDGDRTSTKEGKNAVASA